MESLYNKLGITSQQAPGTVPIGLSASGTPLYGSQQALNDNTPDLPVKLASTYKEGLNVIGAADKDTNEHIDNLILKLKDPYTVDILNQHRASNDPKKFGKTLGELMGTSTPEATTAIYDAWGVMTPNQKGAALLHSAGKQMKLTVRNMSQE